MRLSHMRDRPRGAIAPDGIEERGDDAPRGAVSPNVPRRSRGMARLSARRWRRSHSGTGPRFASIRLELRMASASSWQGSVVTPGGAPAPPECVACEPRPQAPHPAPPRRRLAKRPLMDRVL